MNSIESIRNRMLTQSSGRHNIQVLLDNNVLFEGTGLSMIRWRYVHYVDDVLTYESLQPIESDLFSIFIEDIIDQLSRGIHRDKLIMNIPRVIKTVQVGNKIVEV